jgi:hypothetical protein
LTIAAQVYAGKTAVDLASVFAQGVLLVSDRRIHLRRITAAWSVTAAPDKTK